MSLGKPGAQRGFTYIWLVASIAIGGIGLAALGPLWEADDQRWREGELLRIGAAYAKALADYHQASPGNLKTYPRLLEELTLDSRFIGGRRHLRKLYPDPMSPGRPWGVLRDADGNIQGIYSLDERAPFRRTEYLAPGTRLAPATRYLDWKFKAEVPK